MKRQEKVTDGAGRLRKTIFVGDRIRLDRTKSAAREYQLAYQFNPDEIRTVTRIDSGPRGARLWVDGAPHMFYAADVDLAWNSPAERREALIAAGYDV